MTSSRLSDSSPTTDQSQPQHDEIIFENKIWTTEGSLPYNVTTFLAMSCCFFLADEVELIMKVLRGYLARK